WRNPSGIERARGLAQRAGEIARRQRPGRVDLSPALLPVECVLVVYECASRDCSHGRYHRSAFTADLPNRQRDVEHVGVPASIRLQGWTEDGPGKRVPGLVGTFV